MMIENTRQCILTRKRLAKTELFRLVKVDNKPVLDVSYKMPGRGYYLVKDKEVIEKMNLKRLGGLFPSLKEEELTSLKEVLYGLL